MAETGARQLQPGYGGIDTVKAWITTAAQLVQDILHPGSAGLGRRGDQYVIRPGFEVRQ